MVTVSRTLSRGVDIQGQTQVAPVTQGRAIGRRLPIAPLVLLISVVLLIHSTVTFAHSTEPRSEVVTWVSQGAQGLKYGAPPKMEVVAGAAGEVVPGDLFLLDATGASSTFVTNLTLTNTAQLSRIFSLATMKVGVYQEKSAGNWIPVSAINETIGGFHLTTLNGQVSIILAGGYRYALTVDGGVYMGFATNAPGEAMSPEMRLDVKLP